MLSKTGRQTPTPKAIHPLPSIVQPGTAGKYSIAEGRGNGKGGERVDQLKEKAVQIAGKYFDLVEKRIDSAEELTGSDLRDIYEGIQMMGHITATLERFSRMESAEWQLKRIQGRNS